GMSGRRLADWLAVRRQRGGQRAGARSFEALRDDALYQRILDLALRTDRVELLRKLGRSTEQLQPGVAREFLAGPRGGGERTHATRAERRHKPAVCKLAGNARSDALMLEPLVNAPAQRHVERGQQQRQLGQAGRERGTRGRAQRRRDVPADRRVAEAVV